MTRATRLDSWKEIAQYLGRDVRTVIRWEERGLPVHRVAGGRLSRVFAFTGELDDWLANGPALEPDVDDPPVVPPAVLPVAAPVANHARVRLPMALRLLLGATALLTVIGLMAAWPHVPPMSPDRLELSGGYLLAYEHRSSAPLWQHRLTDGDVFFSPPRWHALVDLDGDSRRDIFAAVQAHRTSSTEDIGLLLRLTPAGSVDWSLSVQDRIRFREGEYGPPWPTDGLAVYRSGTEARLAWIVHQHTWWPGLVVSLNAAGERRALFVNSGWIRAVEPSADGRFLFVSGVNNGHRAYFLAVLDARAPSGRSPEPPGAPTECLSCPDGSPLHYFVFPRTEIGRHHPFPAAGPSLQTFADGTTQLQTHESGDGTIGTVIYGLAGEATLRSARFSDAFWERHRQLELSGILTHRVDQCPERAGLDVQHWTPASGWRTLRLDVR